MVLRRLSIISEGGPARHSRCVVTAARYAVSNRYFFLFFLSRDFSLFFFFLVTTIKYHLLTTIIETREEPRQPISPPSHPPPSFFTHGLKKTSSRSRTEPLPRLVFVSDFLFDWRVIPLGVFLIGFARVFFICREERALHLIISLHHSRSICGGASSDTRPAVGTARNTPAGATPV